MMFYVILACLAAVQVHGSYNNEGNSYNGDSYKYEENHKPQPYSFGYIIKDKEGVQHREESGDGYGVVKGAYGFYDNKGKRREVEYLADKGGFKAKIRTNEPGTSNQAPASVNWNSNDPYAQGAAIPYNSIPNVPYVAGLVLADPKYGFPTVHDFHQFSIDKTGEQQPPYGPDYTGGLIYSNILGAGYRFPRQVVYFGAPLVGGKITGFNTLFAQQWAGNQNQNNANNL